VSTTDSSSKAPVRNRAIIAGTALLLLVVLAYLPVLRAQYIWDDDWYVTENLSLRSLEGLRSIWFEPTRQIVVSQYYPLTYTSFWLEYHLWGLDPFGYHLVNVLLHGTIAVLLWRLLLAFGVPGAWVVAAVWAVHPVMVESVAWVSERKNVLSGVFAVAAVLAYRRFDPDAFGSVAEPRRWRWYVTALLLFLAALTSKTVTSTLPAALLLIVWLKRGTIRIRDALPLVPWVVAGAAAGALTIWMERHAVGARGVEWSLTAADRVLIAGRALWFYTAKLLWPAHLAFNYERWAIDPAEAWQWAFPIAVAVVGAALLAGSRRIGRGPLTAVLLFAGTLTPALGFFDVYPMRYSFVADHFQYLASIALIALAVAAGMRAPILTRAAPLVIGVLAVLTWRRAGVFENPETLWRDTLAKNPRSWLAHANLERYYGAIGAAEKAVEAAAAVVALRSDDARARSRLALDLAAAGRKEEARQEHVRAVELAPDDGFVRYNYGLDLARWNEIEAAEGQYRKAIEVEPKIQRVRTHLGRILVERGDLEGAIDLFRQERELNRDAPWALGHLANALIKLGRLDEAEAVLQDQLRVDPESAAARSTLAVVLMRREDVRGAERELRRALRARPGLAEAHNTLGVVLAAQGRREESIAEYREALRLRPGYENAQRNLTAAMTQQPGVP
jgi:tetratricopeptide (TPR) repeat protein